MNTPTEINMAATGAATRSVIREMAAMGPAIAQASQALAAQLRDALPQRASESVTRARQHRP